MKNAKGISLIVLIITIVVIIILATAIIVNLAQTNITKNAEFAAFVSEYTTVQEAERLYEAESLLKEPYVKEYAVTSEKVEPSENLQKILEQIYGNKSIIATADTGGNVIEDASGAELYKVDLEKLNIKNTKYEYALNIDDGMLFLTEGHAQGKELYFTPEHKIKGKQEVVKDTTPPNDFNISAVFKDGYEQIEIKVGNVTDNESNTFKYEYHIQNVTVDSTTGEITETITDEKITNDSYSYLYSPNQSGYYNIYVIVYDKVGNSKQSTNSVIVHAELKNTIHVSTNGNDTEGIGTKDAPYATIAKAIDAATDGDRIFIWAGEYTLTPLACPTGPYTGYSSAGIYDSNKEVEIIGENEKTILTFDAATASTRDGNAICLKNSNSVIRNLTYIFKPKSGQQYSRAIFNTTNGIIQNVFFRISGSITASHTYNGETTRVNNCTFYHDLGSKVTSYNGNAVYTNIATNVTTDGNKNNVVENIFAHQSMTTAQIIKASKDNTEFISNQVGVFYGKYAWNDYEVIDYVYNPKDYEIHVAVNGNDTDGNGTKDAPYATVKKAITVAKSGDKIHILEGEYTLESMPCPVGGYNGYCSAGIYDSGKALTIYGDNEKTILTYDGATASTRDGCAVSLNNASSVVRNLTYVFKPKSSSNTYSKAIFTNTAGTIENVFFRTIGTNIPTNSAYSTSFNVKNCTFFHDLESFNSDGTCGIHTNIATNVTLKGTNTNVVTESFGTADMNLIDLINASKNNSEFNNASAGVYYGQNAWIK